jgi:hypothetical protein
MKHVNRSALPHLSPTQAHVPLNLEVLVGCRPCLKLCPDIFPINAWVEKLARPDLAWVLEFSAMSNRKSSASTVNTVTHHICSFEAWSFALELATHLLTLYWKYVVQNDVGSIARGGVEQWHTMWGGSGSLAAMSRCSGVLGTALSCFIIIHKQTPFSPSYTHRHTHTLYLKCIHLETSG